MAKTIFHLSYPTGRYHLAVAGGSHTSRDALRLPTRYREVVLTCSIGRLNRGDKGLHIYLSDNCYVLWENLSVFWFCTGNQANSKVVLLPSD